MDRQFVVKTITSDEIMKVLTVYEQNEYVFSDKIRRITPIKLRPIDKKNYQRKRTVFSGGDTNFKVLPIKQTIEQPYEWSAKEIKPKIEFKPKFENDIKPLIKCESKDGRLLIKSEFKPEFKHKIKDEIKEEIIKGKEKSKDVSSDPLPDSEAVKRKTSSEELAPNKKNCLDIETDVESNADNDFECFEDMDETSLDSDETPLTPQMPEDMDETTLDSVERPVTPQQFQDIDETTLDSDAISHPPQQFEDMDETTLDSDETPLTPQMLEDMDETTLDSIERAVTPQQFEDMDETTLDSDEIQVVAQESNQSDQNSRDHNYCTTICTPSDVSLPTNDNLNNTLESSTSSASTDTTIIYEITTPVVKDSFDRFEPKLRTKVYNLILSSLSLEDKLKDGLELVCKEWRKIIVSQQKTLKFHYKQKKGNRSLDISFCGNVITFANSQHFNEVSQTLITKFSELTDIEVLGKTNTNINPIVNKINEKIVGLTSVKLRGQISTDVLTRFGLYFGDQLKSIDINSGSYCLTDGELIESELLSKSLESIHVTHCMNRLTLTSLPQLKQLLDVSHTDINGLKVVADRYAEQITKISFCELLDCQRYPKTLKRIGETLEQLSRFENLEYLDFYFSKISLDSEFQPIEQKCKHLRELHIFGSYSHFSLQRLSALKELKVLGLFIDCLPHTPLDFSALTSLDLTELWMYCDIYSEELQIILKSMKNLKTLHIKSNFCYESQIIELINCDSNLRSIYLEDSLITKKTGSAIVDKAKCNPKVHYSLMSDVFADKNNNNECKQLIRNDLPKNLTIIMHRDKADPFPKMSKRVRKPKKLTKKQTETHTEWHPINRLPPPKQLTDIHRISIQIRGPDPNCEWLRDHNYSTTLCWRFFSSERNTWLSNAPTVP